MLAEKHPTNRRNGKLAIVSPFFLAACVILAAVHENGMKSLHPRIAQETTAPLQNPASVPRSARHPRSLPEKDSPSRSAETSGNPKHSHQCEHGPATDREPKPNTATEKTIREPRMQPLDSSVKRSCGQPPRAPQWICSSPKTRADPIDPAMAVKCGQSGVFVGPSAARDRSKKPRPVLAAMGRTEHKRRDRSLVMDTGAGHCGLRLLARIVDSQPDCAGHL